MYNYSHLVGSPRCSPQFLQMGLCGSCMILEIVCKGFPPLVPCVSQGPETLPLSSFWSLDQFPWSSWSIIPILPVINFLDVMAKCVFEKIPRVLFLNSHYTSDIGLSWIQFRLFGGRDQGVYGFPLHLWGLMKLVYPFHNQGWQVFSLAVKLVRTINYGYPLLLLKNPRWPL